MNFIELREVILSKRIDLNYGFDKKNKWLENYLDLGDIFKNDPKGFF